MKRAALLCLLLTATWLAGGCPPRTGSEAGTISGDATVSGGTTTTGGTSSTQTFAEQLAAQYPGCQATSDPDALTAEVLNLVNQERAARGLAALQYSDDLEQQAMIHACEMIQNNFFAHENPVTGSTPGDRIAASGFPALTYGENIAAGQTSAQDVVDGWMNSAGHRANILNGQFTHLGVGVRLGGSYGVYWVQLFAG